MGALKLVFWSSLGALAWTHGGYPAALTALARMRGRPVRKAEGTPTVSVIVPAHDEEAVIERRVGNLPELDYPPDRVEIVVSSDASTDRTDELVEAISRQEPRGSSAATRRQSCGTEPCGQGDDGPGRRLLRCERDLGSSRAPQARPQLR
jgi:cellulose synthase/poly-beta-1,6-N-acetylglucosamine synthase-like glycosyltransferase